MRNIIKKIRTKNVGEMRHYAKNKIILPFFRIKSFFLYHSIKFFSSKYNIDKINLCGGSVNIPGFYNTDIFVESDLYLDLEKKRLPFKKDSVKILVCISAINYFTREKGQEIIHDVYKIMRPGAIVRFGTQDLELIAKKYAEKDTDFFFQKLPNGKERFTGQTMGDKLNSWFYGYAVAKGKGCKYFYDFETLSLVFKEAGFSKIEKKDYLNSEIDRIELIDNRPDQMFFLEAVK